MNAHVGNVSSLLGRSPEDYGLEDAANDDEEVVALETFYTDALGRKLFATVGWNAATQCADWVDVWNEDGVREDVDFDIREAIVAEVLK